MWSNFDIFKQLLPDCDNILIALEWIEFNHAQNIFPFPLTTNKRKEFVGFVILGHIAFVCDRHPLGAKLNYMVKSINTSIQSKTTGWQAMPLKITKLRQSHLTALPVQVFVFNHLWIYEFVLPIRYTEYNWYEVYKNQLFDMYDYDHRLIPYRREIWVNVMVYYNSGGEIWVGLWAFYCVHVTRYNELTTKQARIL